MLDDYGYFGEGIDGYVHYMQAVGECGEDDSGEYNIGEYDRANTTVMNKTAAEKSRTSIMASLRR